MLISLAWAAPVVHPSSTYVLEVGGDLHADSDHRQAGQYPVSRFAATASYPDRMHADAMLFLGDLSGDRKVDQDGDRVWDCQVDRAWTATCEYPSPWAASLWTTGIASYGAGLPVWSVAGNHDGNPPVPPFPALDRPNEWWLAVVDPMGQPGHTDWSAPAHQEIELDLAGGSWTLLLLSDWSWMQDRSVGGRCDLRGWSGLTAGYQHCSTRGWPNGVISTEQLVWLEAAIARAEAEGRYVLVGTHQPPSHTTVLTGAPGEAHAEVCPGVRVHSADLESHYPRDADLLPLRTDLDGPGNPREIAWDWASSLLRWESGMAAPDLDWAVDLVRRHPGVVRVWVSAHNHLPVPDLVYAGRGVRYDDPASGTTWLAHGAVTTTWCTTAGACPQQAARLELHADGSWSWERWALQLTASPALPAGCATAASVPATRPGPWTGLPIETGP